MFDEQQADDDELEDIIEQPIEEESGEGDSDEDIEDVDADGAEQA
jgi:hypothetical protein